MGKIIKKNEGTLIKVLNDEHIIKIDGSDTNNMLSVIEQTYQPNNGSVSHLHEKDTHVFYVLKGVFKMVLDNLESEMFPGDIAYIPNGVCHSFNVISNNDGKALVYTFPAGLENLFIELSQVNLNSESISLSEIASKYGVKLK